jgi:hypothetical protein
MQATDIVEKAGEHIAVLDDAVEEQDWPRARMAWRALEPIIPGLTPKPKTKTELSLRETQDIRDGAQATNSWTAAATANRHLIELRNELEEQKRQSKKKRKPVSELTREQYLARQLDDLVEQAERVKGRDVQGHARLMSEIRQVREQLDTERAAAKPVLSEADLEDLFVDGLARLPATKRALILARVEERTRQ